MSRLAIRMKKLRDGSAALTCTRADGSVTWQRMEGKNGGFFPRHDLTHYAVETVLGHRRGFFGLVAEGWDFTDFGTPWPRGPIPADADPSELIVGLLDSQRASGAEWTAAEMMVQAAAVCAGLGAAGATLALSEGELVRIRDRRAALFARWDAVPPGETLELCFDPSAPGLGFVDDFGEPG